MVQSRMIGRCRVHAIHAEGSDSTAARCSVSCQSRSGSAASHPTTEIASARHRCLVIEHESGPVLIDTGAGNKEDSKFHDIYGIENRAPTGVLDSRMVCARSECVPRLVHRHQYTSSLRPRGRQYVAGCVRRWFGPTFPNARYVVQAGEYDYAIHTNERTAASYFPHNFAAVLDSGRFDFVEGEREIVAGVRVIPTPGHTPHHQSILIESAGKRAFYLADLVPTPPISVAVDHGLRRGATRNLETSDASFAARSTRTVLVSSMTPRRRGACGLRREPTDSPRPRRRFLDRVARWSLSFGPTTW